MAHVNKVVMSINEEGAGCCVDVFVRGDGTFGFEEYRRDVEDGRGWFPIGGYRERSFAAAGEALEAATAAVAWLAAARGSMGAGT